MTTMLFRIGAHIGAAKCPRTLSTAPISAGQPDEEDHRQDQVRERGDQVLVVVRRAVAGLDRGDTAARRPPPAAWRRRGRRPRRSTASGCTPGRRRRRPCAAAPASAPGRWSGCRRAAARRSGPAGTGRSCTRRRPPAPSVMPSSALRTKPMIRLTRLPTAMIALLPTVLPCPDSTRRGRRVLASAGSSIRRTTGIGRDQGRVAQRRSVTVARRVRAPVEAAAHPTSTGTAGAHRHPRPAAPHGVRRSRLPGSTPASACTMQHASIGISGSLSASSTVGWCSPLR